jgi:radical SAM enzyme (TIGR01210 family)
MTLSSLPSFPVIGPERDAWILARRPGRNEVDPFQPYAFLVEDERAPSGEVVPVTTVFLTNRECPWRCLMCDLWRNTLVENVPVGAIPAQIDYALQRLTLARQIKLYNSGSFFDPRAIPTEDHPAIATCVAAFERVIVECHPALVADPCVRFRDLIPGKLEVAMGLETVHTEILKQLNKRMTIGQFAAAAQFLQKNEIDLRAFILVKPPFMREDEALEWAVRSLEFAFECGATAATLIPTRGGNGAMEQLAAAAQFSPPRLATLEAAVAHGIAMKKGRVFADLWDVQTEARCPDCFDLRIARLQAMNLQQSILPSIACHRCGGNS